MSLIKLSLGYPNQIFSVNSTYYSKGCTLKSKWWLGKVKNNIYSYRFYSLTNPRRNVTFVMHSCSLLLDIYKKAGFLFNHNQVVVLLDK